MQRFRDAFPPHLRPLLADLPVFGLIAKGGERSIAPLRWSALDALCDASAKEQVQNTPVGLPEDQAWWPLMRRSPHARNDPRLDPLHVVRVAGECISEHALLDRGATDHQRNDEQDRDDGDLGAKRNAGA